MSRLAKPELETRPNFRCNNEFNFLHILITGDKWASEIKVPFRYSYLKVKTLKAV